MNAPDLFYQNYSVLGSPIFGEAYRVPFPSILAFLKAKAISCDSNSSKSIILLINLFLWYNGCRER